MRMFLLSLRVSLIVFLLQGPALAGDWQIQPSDLRCEYRVNPLGIDETEPRFAWQIEDQQDARGLKQTAYRLLVASSEEMLAEDQADLWDSDRVDSGQSVLVPYSGKPLVSGTDCYWKVKVWTDDLKGRTESAWSEPARFSIGLLEGSDWKGSWIEYSGDDLDGVHVWYRKTFTLDDPAARAFVYVASLGYHELYVNGEKVDDSVLAPAGSRLDKRVLYVTYDVTDMLQDGKNVLAIWHGPGWTRFFKAFKTEPALLVQADITTQSGEERSIVSDETWKCQASESKTIGKSGHGGYGGEEVDARKQIADWNAVGFDDSDWDHATPTKRDIVLSAQAVEPDRVIETIKPVEIERLKSGDCKVDMGRNYTGWLEIRNLRGKPGQEITLRIADDPKSKDEFGQVSRYICGEEPGTFRNRFNYAGGRYVRISGLSYQPKLTDVRGYAVSTDLERTGHFECSNDLLNRIYETDLRTFRANTVNAVTMDCPHRERLGYGEVSWATAWGCGLPNYRASAFYKHVIRNWCDVQHEDGSIWFVAPQMRYTYGGTLWSSAPLTTGWEMYRQYGDKRVLKDAYPTFRRWMAYLHSKVSEKAGGILTQYIKHRGRFLGDWAAPRGRKEWGGSQEALLFNNCVYALDLKMMIDVAEALSKEEDVALYSARLEDLRKNIHKRFFDPGNNIYLGGRQVHLAFPLYVGVVPDEVKPAVIANLKKEITETQPYLDMGSSGLPVLLHYLIEDAEWNDILYQHLGKKTRPSYGYFLEQDETAWPEYWSSTCASKIHTCYTGVASWFIKGIGGIRNDPDDYGYKQFVVKPYLVGDLTYANTTIESLYGKIVSNWARKDGNVTLNVQVPPNSTAKIYLPSTSDRKGVTESGKPLEKAEGVDFMGMKDGRTVVRVVSGQYSFASRCD